MSIGRKSFVPGLLLCTDYMQENVSESGRFSDAVMHLADSDKVLSGLIKSVGDCTLKKRDNYFLSLISAVVNQQLSGSAADSIYKKFSSTLDGEVTPEKVLNLSPEQFRKAGISKSKESFIRGISREFMKDSNFLLDVNSKSDSEVLSTLMDLRGVGEWTAQMFMIFSLNRLDVLPIGDAGFRKSVSRFYFDGEEVSDEDLLRISEKWRPYRSIAVWYLWRGIDKAPRGPIQS